MAQGAYCLIFLNGISADEAGIRKEQVQKITDIYGDRQRLHDVNFGPESVIIPVLCRKGLVNV